LECQELNVESTWGTTRLDYDSSLGEGVARGREDCLTVDATSNVVVVVAGCWQLVGCISF